MTDLRLFNTPPAAAGRAQGRAGGSSDIAPGGVIVPSVGGTDGFDRVVAAAASERTLIAGEVASDSGLSGDAAHSGGAGRLGGAGASGGGSVSDAGSAAALGLAAGGAGASGGGCVCGAGSAVVSPAGGAGGASGGDLGFGAGVWVEVAALLTTRVDVCELNGERLKARMGLINLGEARLAALKSEIVVEVTDRDGASVATDVVSSVSRESRGSARRKVTDADRLADVPKTAEALGAGVITPREAKKIADANKAAPIDEDFLLGAAQEGLPGSFDDAVRRHVNDQTRGMDVAAIRRRQRSQRRANISQRPDGMYSLYAEFDAVAGARVAKEISTRADKLWRTEDSRDRATPEQRTADALEQLIVDKNTKGKMPITQLSVFVDYDALLQAATAAGLLNSTGPDGSDRLLGSNGPLGAAADGSNGRGGSGGLLGSDFLERIRNPRLDNGTPLSVEELLALTCDAHILPAVFRNSTQPLWLGRRYRHASDGQRTALAKRDLGCVGCEAPPDRCQAHHIVHWAHGGPTDLDNLVLLCSRCHHHEVHTLGAEVVQDPAGRYRLEHPPGPPTRRSRNPSHWAALDSAPTLTIRLPHALTGPPPPAIPPDMLRGAINLDDFHDPEVPLISPAASTAELIDISRRCPGGTNLEHGRQPQPRRRRGSRRPVPLACSGSDQPTAATIAHPSAGNATDVPGPPTRAPTARTRSHRRGLDGLDGIVLPAEAPSTAARRPRCGLDGLDGIVLPGLEEGRRRVGSECKRARYESVDG